MPWPGWDCGKPGWFVAVVWLIGFFVLLWVFFFFLPVLIFKQSPPIKQTLVNSSPPQVANMTLGQQEGRETPGLKRMGLPAWLKGKKKPFHRLEAGSGQVAGHL